MTETTVSTTMSDERLLELGCASNGQREDAWRVLDRRLRPQLIRWLQARRGFTEDRARDLAQRGLVRIFEHGHRQDDDLGSLRTFLFSVTDNLAKNAYRNRQRKPEISVELLAGDDDSGSSWLARHTDPARSYDPEAETERRELADALEEEIENLRPEVRAAVRLRREGHKYREIAEQTDAALGTVKSRLSRVKETLRKRLSDRGFEVEAVAG